MTFQIRAIYKESAEACGVSPSGVSDELHSFGSVDYWLRLRIPMTETIRLFRERMKAVGYVHTALKDDTQVRESERGFCVLIT